MTKYEIVSGSTVFDLKEKVNELCAQGWKPNGSVFHDGWVHQPMIYEERETTPKKLVGRLLEE